MMGFYIVREVDSLTSLREAEDDKSGIHSKPNLCLYTQWYPDDPSVPAPQKWEIFKGALESRSRMMELGVS